MNLKKVQKEVSKVFKDWLDIEFTMKDGCLRGDLNFTIKGCDDDVSGMLLFYERTDRAVFFFFFDEIEKNSHTLDLVNAYNANDNALTAYIDEDPENGTSLILHHICLVTDDSMVGDYTREVMNELLDDDALKDLIAITEHTY